jgi:hypothetical protein
MTKDIETWGKVNQEKLGILSDRQLKLLENLLKIVDRSPVLDGVSPGHNRDFIMFKDRKGGTHIEMMRDFGLKMLVLANLNAEPVSKEHVNYRDDLCINVDVRVWDDQGTVTECGGCTVKEVESKHSGFRGYHDALAIAYTRALKRALEAKVELPFVNLLIEMLFGSYGKPAEKNVTPAEGEKPEGKKEKQDIPQIARDMGNEMFSMLKTAIKQGLMAEKDAMLEWNRVMVNIDKPEVLKNIRSELKGRLDVKRTVKETK